VHNCDDVGDEYYVMNNVEYPVFDLVVYDVAYLKITCQRMKSEAEIEIGEFVV